MSTPTFSILHPTIRLPDGWRKAAATWTAMADNPAAVDHILIVDSQDIERLPLDDMRTRHVVINTKRHCYVDAINSGAAAANGDWLICAADDWFPVPHWDTEITRLVSNPRQREAIVNVVNGHHPTLIIYPIMSRAYYERPGRGGCSGHYFYPDYISMGSDDDLSLYAKRDGIVVESSMEFMHVHPWRGMTEHETHDAYAHVQSIESWHAKDAILPRRIAENFSK